jgi:hypothetical protein
MKVGFPFTIMNKLDKITEYKLVDVLLQPPQPTIQTCRLTKWEADIKNRAYRMNGTTLKYIKLHEVGTQTKVPVD